MAPPLSSDDSTILAVIFCTKDVSRDNQPLEPLIELAGLAVIRKMI